MKKKVMAVWVAAGVGTALAAEIFVPFRERAVLDASAGETVTQTGAVALEAESALYKTGAGTFVFPWSELLPTETPFRVGVREGTFVLDTRAAAAAGTVAQPAVMNQAAFWVSAKSGAGLTVTNTAAGTPVAARWHDVRETKTAAPFDHPFAMPAWDSNNPTRPLYGIPPEVTTFKGEDAVYFGRYGSTQSMTWRKADDSGVNKLTGIRRVFLAVSVVNSWGFVLGTV